MRRKIVVFMFLLFCLGCKAMGEEPRLRLNRCIYIISNLPEHRPFDDVDKSVYSKRMSYLLKNVVAKNFVEFGFDMGWEIESIWYDCHQEWLHDDVHPEFSFKIGKVESERAEVDIAVYSPEWNRTVNLKMILVLEDGDWRLDDWFSPSSSPSSKKTECERYLETPLGELFYEKHEKVNVEYSVYVDGVESDVVHASRLYSDSIYVVDYKEADEVKNMTDIPGAVSVMVVKTSDGIVHKLVGVMRELLSSSKEDSF